MKKVLLTVAAVGLTLVAFGQGNVALDNSANSVGGPTLDTAGNFYGGPYGLEVWFRNGTTVDTAINALSGTGAPGANNAYALLAADGFSLVTTLSGQNNTPTPGAGVIAMGELRIAGVNPKASSITLALVMWTGSAATFTDAANASGKGGVLNFANPTGDYTITATHPTPDLPPPLSGWNDLGQDLVMTQLQPIPEPATFALAGLGAAALLIFRRRK